MNGELVDPTHRLTHRSRLVRLWAAVLGGPAAWFVFLQTDYALVHLACRAQSNASLTIVAAITAIAAIAAAFLGFTAARTRVEHTETGVERTRFLGLLGAALGAFFALLILVSAVPTLVLDPCQ